MGAAADDLDGLIKPLANRPLRYFFNSVCSFIARLYRPPKGASQPGFNSISISYGRCGGSTESCREKMCEYDAQSFDNSGEIFWFGNVSDTENLEGVFVFEVEI